MLSASRALSAAARQSAFAKQAALVPALRSFSQASYVTHDKPAPNMNDTPIPFSHIFPFPESATGFKNVEDQKLDSEPPSLLSRYGFIPTALFVATYAVSKEYIIMDEEAYMFLQQGIAYSLIWAFGKDKVIEIFQTDEQGKEDKDTKLALEINTAAHEMLVASARTSLKYPEYLEKYRAEVNELSQLQAQADAIKPRIADRANAIAALKAQVQREQESTRSENANKKTLVVEGVLNEIKTSAQLRSTLIDHAINSIGKATFEGHPLFAIFNKHAAQHKLSRK